MGRLVTLFLCSLLLISCKKEKESSLTELNNKNDRFSFVLTDTIGVGRNFARIQEYSRDLEQNQIPFISVYVKNEKEDGTITIDTFSDGLTNPFFGITRYSLGDNKVEFTVEEKIATKTKIGTDSAKLDIDVVLHNYDYDVFVKGNGFKSPLNTLLRKAMKEDYKKFD